VRALRILQVDVGIYPAGDDQQTAGIQGFGAVWKSLGGEFLPYGNDFVASNSDVGLKGIAGRDQSPILNEQISLTVH
jgi:hypothetical protein